MTAPRVAELVSRYAERLHRLLGSRHSVCSPAGAWLLLALVADAATGSMRTELTEVLGCDPSDAAPVARTMLADPPPALAAAAAIWRDPRVPSRSLDALVERVSPPVEPAAIPTQERADEWARERTFGLVERFPLDLDHNPLLRPAVVLATALATKIDWRVPFDTLEPDLLMRPASDERFAGVGLLRVPREPHGHWQGIIDGRYAAHCAWSPDDLVVASVIGDPDDDPVDVLAMAQWVATCCAIGMPPETTSLVDLPIGDGPAWRISKLKGKGRPERYETVLAAWEAADSHDLLADPALGFSAAGRTLLAMLPPDDYRVAARQSTTARYTRTGFDAAVVTAEAVVWMSGVREVSKSRLAQLQFTHPYAVAAASAAEGVWQGVPVFSAWIAQPTPAA